MGIPLTIFLFFVYCVGLGYTFTRFLKNNLFETLIVRLGIGLGAFVVLGVFLNFFHIPLDWRIFLVLSLIVPVYDLVVHHKRITLTNHIFNIRTNHILLLFLFFISLAIYYQGAFAYPWLEDSDSWFHAAGIKYVQVEKNLNVPYNLYEPFRYINPYPPGYDLLIGVLHQTSPSMYVTLKFFNLLIISLSFLFFFFFVRELTRSTCKATFATFFLTCIPCYLSHFIWAHSLVLTLFFPAFYTILKASRDKHFILAAAICFAAIALTQPTQALKFLIMFLILLAVISFQSKKINKNLLIVFALMVVFSLLWWGPVLIESQQQLLSQAKGTLSPTGGSTSIQAFPLKYYFFPPKANWIHNPAGVGLVIMIFAILGIMFCSLNFKKLKKQEKIFRITILSWFLFALVGLNSATFKLPIGLFPYRFWMLFAVPVCVLAADAASRISAKLRQPILRSAYIILLVIGTLVSSGYFKYINNTGTWTWGIFWTAKERDGFLWLRHNLPIDTKVFSYVDNHYVVGQDMACDFWSDDYKNTFESAFDMTAKDFYTKLKDRGFQYMIISARDIRKYGVGPLKAKLNELVRTKAFVVVHRIQNSVYILKIV